MKTLISDWQRLFNWQFQQRRRNKRQRRVCPFLPRVGIYVDWGRSEFALKYTPLSEAFLELLAERPSLYRLQTILRRQRGEMKFWEPPRQDVITTTSRPIDGPPPY